MSGRLAQFLENLAGYGMSPGFRFLEDRLSVRHDLEPSTLGWNQLDVRVRVMLLELGGQTGRPGLVASIGAVLDGDFHFFLRVGACAKYMRRGAPPSSGGWVN